MTDDKINNLLLGEEPVGIVDQSKKPFKPKFNVREEFALWVREQFPDLPKYAKKKGIYHELEERRQEVYEAALGAVNHGVTSTTACATSRLHSGWTKFETGFDGDGTPKKRAKSLEGFVRAVEDLSISLGGDTHFTEAGVYLDGRGYGGFGYGNLNAFVYRQGDENGLNTSYLVFETAQEFSGEDIPVLIGELTQLSKFGYGDLQKIADKFKGSETDFIEKVDRMVPEMGMYSYSGYGLGRSYGRNTPITRSLREILGPSDTNRQETGGFTSYGAE